MTERVPPEYVWKIINALLSVCVFICCGMTAWTLKTVYSVSLDMREIQSARFTVQDGRVVTEKLSVVSSRVDVLGERVMRNSQDIADIKNQR